MYGVMPELCDRFPSSVKKLRAVGFEGTPRLPSKCRSTAILMRQAPLAFQGGEGQSIV